MKKTLIICISLAMFLSFVKTPTTVFADTANTFLDMPNDWSTAALKKSVDNGLLKGTDGKILPQENLTRSQMAAVIERAFGATEKASLDLYKDVSKSDWFYDSMAKAVFMKTFQGDGKKLNPNNYITREEAFVVIARSLKLSGASKNAINKFYDNESISEWALDGVASMVSVGYISGADGRINPKKYITRAEFAQVMDNILKNYITKSGTYTDNFNGNVIINVPNVVLSNLTINGDLIIADGVGNGDITLHDVTITGRTVIRGGGINSIKITGESNLQNIIIARIDGQVRIYAEDGTEIGEVIADGSDDIIIEGNFGNITVSAPDITVTAIGANINSAVVSGENSKIIIDDDSKAKKIILSSNNSSAEISGVVTNVQITEDAVNARVSTLSGSKISKIDIDGEGATVSGKGRVVSVDANADNIKVTTPNTDVTAGRGTSGVTAGGVAIKSGQSATTNGAGTGITGIASTSSSKKQLTISEPTLILKKSYDGNNTANVVAGTLIGVASGHSVEVTATAYYDNAKVGANKTITVEYTISGENVSKYIKPVNYVINTGEITAKQLSLSTPELTTEKIYDGNKTAAISAGELSGIVAGEIVTVNASASYETKAVGTGKMITVEYTLSGADSSNYIKPVNYVINTGKITAKQLTVSNSKLSTEKEYDGNLTAVTNITDETLTGVIEGDAVNIAAAAKYDTATVGTSKTITVKYSISGEDAGNYIKPADYIVNIGEITAVQLTISEPILTLTKAYDGNTTAAITKGTISGIVSSDTVTVNAAASYNNKNVGTGKTITVVYTVVGTDKDNYMAPTDYVANNGEITALQLAVTGTDLTLSKAYDGNATAAVSMGALSGKVSGDDLDLSVTASYDNSEIGINKTITVSYVLSGTDAGNYVKPADYAVSNGEIASKQLTISNPALTLTKKYDGNSSASVTAGTLSGVATGQTIIVNAAATYDSEDVGTAKTITVQYTISGDYAANYIKPADYIVNTGEITAIELSVSTPTLTASKVYDGTDAAAVTEGILSGVLSSEDVTVHATASYDNKNVGSDKVLTVKYTINGADKENYIAPSDYVVNTGQITAIQLTISQPTLTVSKEYDENTTATVSAGTLYGVIGGESVNANAEAAYDNPNTGTGKTITVVYTISGIDAGNYIKPENYTVSNGVILTKNQDAPSGLSGILPTSTANNDGKIIGTSDEMQYKLSSAGEWIPVTGTEITGLVPGTYEVRFKAKAGYNASTIVSVIVPEYVASLTSKSITNFDYSTAPATQASLASNTITSSNFTANPVKFDIVDNLGNRIPIHLWWNISGDFTPAQLVGSGIESTIQDWFYANKGGADGIMNRTLYAMGIGDKVTIGSFSTGSSAFIKLYEPGTNNPYASYLFSNNVAYGTGGEVRSATFTISDGTNTATIILNSYYNSISSLVAAINSQISGKGINASVIVNGTDKFTIIGNNLTVSGEDSTTFFSTFITQ